MKNVLVLGSGLVSGPLVRYLIDVCGHNVTLASRTLDKARAIIGDRRKGLPLRFDIEKDPGLGDLVSQHDAVVSLLPYTHHVDVARASISEGVNMVTTSYVSDAMRALDGQARDAGVTLLNEIGLDPGIDHMEAMRVIDRIKAEGGRMVEFISYCGGLPAPEANDNPFGYKFSWSPRGVVLAGRNDARFRKDGREFVIPGKELFANHEIVPIPGLGEFEGYPNRNSVPYADIYGIPEARTVLRGTLRNKGWCDTWKAFHDIGILSDASIGTTTYREWLDSIVEGEGELKARIGRSIRTRDDGTAIANMEWLGLLSDGPIIDRKSGIDALSKLLESRLRYSPGERDMIVLQHIFRAEMNGEMEEVRSTMIDFGIPGGDSAMSRTVGIPAAIGTDLLLRHEDLPKGVSIPTIPEIYIPALDRLRKEGIQFKGN